MYLGGLMHGVGELKKWGNSIGLVIESKTIKRLKLEAGEVVDYDIKVKKRIDAFGKFKGKKAFEEEIEAHKDFW